MLLSDLMADLRNAGSDTDVVQVAELLWAADALDLPVRHTERPAQAPPGDPNTPESTRTETPPGLPSPGADDPQASSSAEPERPVGARVLRIEDDLDVPGVRRSLASLRLTRADGQRVIDEEATVATAARLWLLWPVFRRQRQKSVDLLVIADVGSTMDPWRPRCQRFLRATESMGAFRTVRLWTVDSGAVPLAFHGGWPDRHGPRLEPRDFVSRSHERIVLVLTDGVGAAWGEGSLPEALTELSAHHPVALVNVLRPDHWDSTGWSEADEAVATPAFGERNRLVVVAQQRWRPAWTPTPLPVVALTPGGLRRLAGYLRGEDPLHGLSFEPWDEEEEGSEGVASAEVRVARFFLRASPGGRILARRLPAVPGFASLPILRHIAGLAGLGADPTPIWEVLTGGLLTCRKRVSDPEANQFRVRPELLAPLYRRANLAELEETLVGLADQIGEGRWREWLAEPAAHEGAAAGLDLPKDLAALLGRLGLQRLMQEQSAERSSPRSEPPEHERVEVPVDEGPFSLRDLPLQSSTWPFLTKPEIVGRIKSSAKRVLAIRANPHPGSAVVGYGIRVEDRVLLTTAAIARRFCSGTGRNGIEQHQQMTTSAPFLDGTSALTTLHPLWIHPVLNVAAFAVRLPQPVESPLQLEEGGTGTLLIGGPTGEAGATPGTASVVLLPGIHQHFSQPPAEPSEFFVAAPIEIPGAAIWDHRTGRIVAIALESSGRLRRCVRLSQILDDGGGFETVGLNPSQADAPYWRRADASTPMPSVFTHIDFRRYLKAWLSWRTSDDEAYWSTDELEVITSHDPEVIASASEIISRELALTTDESEYFGLMVDAAQEQPFVDAGNIRHCAIRMGDLWGVVIGPSRVLTLVQSHVSPATDKRVETREDRQGLTELALRSPLTKRFTIDEQPRTVSSGDTTVFVVNEGSVHLAQLDFVHEVGLRSIPEVMPGSPVFSLDRELLGLVAVDGRTVEPAVQAEAGRSPPPPHRPEQALWLNGRPMVGRAELRETLARMGRGKLQTVLLRGPDFSGRGRCRALAVHTSTKLGHRVISVRTNGSTRSFWSNTIRALGETPPRLATVDRAHNPLVAFVRDTLENGPITWLVVDVTQNPKPEIIQGLGELATACPENARILVTARNRSTPASPFRETIEIQPLLWEDFERWFDEPSHPATIHELRRAAASMFNSGGPAAVERMLAEAYRLQLEPPTKPTELRGDGVYLCVENGVTYYLRFTRESASQFGVIEHTSTAPFEQALRELAKGYRGLGRGTLTEAHLRFNVIGEAGLLDYQGTLLDGGALKLRHTSEETGFTGYRTFEFIEAKIHALPAPAVRPAPSVRADGLYRSEDNGEVHYLRFTSESPSALFVFDYTSTSSSLEDAAEQLEQGLHQRFGRVVVQDESLRFITNATTESNVSVAYEGTVDSEGTLHLRHTSERTGEQGTRRYTFVEIAMNNPPLGDPDGWLHWSRQAQRSVAILRSREHHSSGLLIAPDLVLTIPTWDAKSWRGMQAGFKHGQEGWEWTRVEELMWESSNLHAAVIRLAAQRPQDTTVWSLRGTKAPNPDDGILVISHFGKAGAPRTQLSAGRHLESQGSRCHHLVSTSPGWGGSPIFDASGVPYAMHLGTEQPEPSGERKGWGVLFRAILEAMPAEIHEMLPDSSPLESHPW